MSSRKVVVSLGLAIGALVLTRSLWAPPPQNPPRRPKPERQVNLPLPPILKAEPLKVGGNDDRLHRLLKQRYNEAVAEMAERYQGFGFGRGSLDSVYGAGRRLVTAGVEVKDKPEEKIDLLRQYVEMMKQVEQLTEAEIRQGLGAIAPEDLNQARYQRLDAEIQLLRLEQKAK